MSVRRRLEAGIIKQVLHEVGGTVEILLTQIHAHPIDAAHRAAGVDATAPTGSPAVAVGVGVPKLDVAVAVAVAVAVRVAVASALRFASLCRSPLPWQCWLPCEWRSRLR